MSSKEIAILRRQRMKAISDCNFAQAKALEIQIKRLESNTIDQRNEQSLNKARAAYNIEREAVRTTASQKYNDYYNQIFEMKAKFQNRKTALRKSQAIRMTQLAENYAKSLELETTRPIPEAEVLRNQAQIYAKNGNYYEAESIFKRAEGVRIEVVKARQEEVHKNYEAQRVLLEQKNEDENKLCDSKLYDTLLVIKQNYDHEIEKLKRRLVIAALRLKYDRDEDEDNEIFDPLDFDDDLVPVQNAPKTGRLSNLRRPLEKSGNTSAKSASKAQRAKTPRAGNK